MNTRISSKLAALAVALMMNTLIVVGVAYLFNSRIQQNPTASTLDRAAALTLHEVA
jgi:hypothetical protein